MRPESRAVARVIEMHRFKPARLDVERLVRVTSHRSGEPYWSVCKNNRFDCPSTGTSYGVNYSAPALSTAFAESVLHDSRHFDHRSARWVVSDALVLSKRWVVNLQFGIYSRRVMRHASHSSTAHLRERTEAFIAQRNISAKPFE
jgi:hypothetical protein